MPSPPYIVSGTIKDSNVEAEASARIDFETSKGKGTSVANASGQYVFDLAEIGWTAGETVTYTAYDQFENETKTGTFIITGGSKTLNATLVVRQDPQSVRGAKNVQLSNIGGFVVSKDNPLPVTIVKNIDK